jgi:competence protein ComEC
MRIFVAFLGFALGIYVTFHPTVIPIVISNLVAVFIYYRFGLKSLIIYYIAFIVGLLTIVLNINYDYQPSYRGLVIEAKDNYFVFQYKLQRFYVYQRNHGYQTGDYLLIYGDVKPLSFSKIESRFDFEKYLNNKGIYYQIEIKTIEEIFVLPIRRLNIINKFIDKYPQDIGLLTKSLLFGARDYDSEIIVHADKYNLMYLLTLSGIPLHFSITTIEKIIAAFINPKRARIMTIVLLIPYALININSIPLMRIYLGKIINSINESKYESKLSYWQRKGVLGVILLIFSRYIVNSPSFYLGFSLSIILYLCWPLLKRYRTIKRHVLRQVIIWIILLPYLISNYFEINIISYLLVIPIMLFSNLFFLISLFQFYVYPIPFISKPFLIVIKSIFLFANNFVFTIVIGTMSILAVIIYLLSSTYIINLFQNRQKKLAFKVSLLSILIFVTLSLPYKSLYVSRISFINVGQGDSILIQDRKTNILIDTGGNFYFDIATESLIPYFKKHQINSLDALIITHDDFDHSGGKDSLINHFKVKRLLTHHQSFPFSIGSLTLHNLNIDTSKHIDDNDASLVLYFNFINSNWLLMGDASIAIEHSIIENYPHLQTDYIKVGHHGSNTSTCATFIATINPKEAIISVGRNNYGHPHQEVISILNNYDVSIRRTDLEGTITYQKSFF